jgi:hypothetical protein
VRQAPESTAWNTQTVDAASGRKHGSTAICDDAAIAVDGRRRILITLDSFMESSSSATVGAFRDWVDATCTISPPRSTKTLDHVEDLIRNRESRYLLPDLGQHAHHMTVGPSSHTHAAWCADLARLARLYCACSCSRLDE